MGEIIDRLNAALGDRYTIERELGEGGMATVYLAHDLRHERKVALKVLKPELAAVVGAERFLAEIKTTANLQHPHILPLFDSGEADGFLFYVMPYIEGETLRDRLDREVQLPVADAVRIAVAVCGALHHAHRHGVIHRDIKPANILLQDGEPVVSDFGIALAVGSAGGARLTETGLSVGTPYYMSPEQATGDQVIGPASDIYALGCVLYETLVGEPPYPGATAQAVLGKIIAGEAVSATEARASIPPNVDGAIRRALEKLPADRFSSSSDFADALADPTYRHGGTDGGGVEFRSLPWWRTAAPAWAVAAGATLGLVWQVVPRPPAPESILRYSLTLPLEVGLATDYGTNVDLSADGQKLVYASGSDGTPQLWLRERDDLEPVPINGTDGAHQAFFSPDARRVAFISGNRQLRVASLEGESPVTVVDSGLVRAGGDWGRDGYLYFTEGTSAGNPTGGIGRVLATGGPIESVTSLDTTRNELSHGFPEVLPGGRGILFRVSRDRLYDDETMEIAVADLDSGEHRILFQGILARWAVTGHILAVRGDGTLIAAAFDENSLELEGPPTPLLEGIGIEALASADLALSETGTLVYATGAVEANPDQVVWVTRDGVVQEVDPGWAGRFGFPALSPDGSRLAISLIQDAEEQVWVKQLDQGPLAKLTFGGTLTYRPAWTPDGAEIAFISNRAVNNDIFKRRADGSTQAELLVDDEFGLDEVTWSADGAWLLYRSGNPGDLFAIDLEGEGEVIRLTETDFHERSPSFSPDGRWLALVSNESGAPEVYVYPFPDMKEARWLVSTSGGSEPIWGHGGEELFYRSATQDLMSVQVLPGNTFLMGEHRALFSAQPYLSNTNHAYYDVSPDDERFVMVRRAGTGEQDELIVVENFFEVLRERMGG